MQVKISNRLSIRRFVPNDRQSIQPLLQDADSMKYTGFRVPQSSQQIENLMQKWTDSAQEPFGVWAVVDSQNQSLIGWVMLKATDSDDPELGFMLLKTQWGHGYATELATGMIEYGFQALKLKKIIAAADIHNKASIAVLTKAGMQQRSVAKPDKGAAYFEIKNIQKN